MGAPGQSAFTPYTRPPLQQPHLPSPGSGGGLSLGLQGAQAVPAGGHGSGGGGGVAAPPALRIGGSPSAMKRFRDGGAAGGNQPGEGGDHNAVTCSLCGKVFVSAKALFGHMRAHPDRGWKGAHPPPVFRAEEEFADLRVDRHEGAAAVAGGGGAEEREAAERAAKEEEEEEQNYRLPDLNNPPPPEN